MLSSTGSWVLHTAAYNGYTMVGMLNGGNIQRSRTIARGQAGPGKAGLQLIMTGDVIFIMIF